MEYYQHYSTDFKLTVLEKGVHEKIKLMNQLDEESIKRDENQINYSPCFK